MKISKRQLRKMIREEIGSASSRKRFQNEGVDYMVDGVGHRVIIAGLSIKEAIADALFFRNPDWIRMCNRLGIVTVTVSPPEANDGYLSFDIYHGLRNGPDDNPEAEIRYAMQDLEELHYGDRGIILDVREMPPDTFKISVSIPIGYS